MKVDFADNVRIRMCDTINALLPNAKEVKIAVAFAKYSGLRLLESSLDECLGKNGEVEFIVGLDFRTTDAQALRTLFTRAKTSTKCRLYCYSDPSDNAITYHPKLYLFDSGRVTDCIIGSSNLTQGGLKDNVEVNVILGFDEHDEHLETLHDIYAQIKYQPTRFAPDAEYIDAYEDVLRRTERNARRASPDRDIERALNLLRQREMSLPKPFTSPNTLQGWQKMVFDRIPDDIFSTSEMYQFASEFQKAYPDNLHIEPKVRQVLQQLRDLGLILHVGEGRWKKK